MSKMKIRVHESSTSVGAKFYDAFVKDRATEILENYDVNTAEGDMCDAWYGIGDGVEDIERDHRDGYIAWNDGGVEKVWSTTPGSLVGQGYGDKKVTSEYDRMYDDGLEEWRDEHGEDASTDTDEFYEFIDEYTMGESCVFFAEVRIMLTDDGMLEGTLARSFDYEYGRGDTFEDDLSVKMLLREDTMTQANADKFLDVFEEALNAYSFKDGYKKIELKAE